MGGRRCDGEVEGVEMRLGSSKVTGGDAFNGDAVLFFLFFYYEERTYSTKTSRTKQKKRNNGKFQAIK